LLEKTIYKIMRGFGSAYLKGGIMSNFDDQLCDASFHAGQNEVYDNEGNSMTADQFYNGSYNDSESMKKGTCETIDCHSHIKIIWKNKKFIPNTGDKITVKKSNEKLKRYQVYDREIIITKNGWCVELDLWVLIKEA